MSQPSPSPEHHKVVIVGGTGGITVAARLRRAGIDDVTIVEPSSSHYYQPLFTLVGGGRCPQSETARPEASVMPKGVTWVHDAAAAPAAQTVTTQGGCTLHYDYLVMAPGIQLDFGQVPGLTEVDGDSHRAVISDTTAGTKETIDYDITSRNRMLLAKFDYDFKRTPTLPFINTLKPRYDMWLLKRYGLPSLYWNLMVKGLA